MHQMPLSLLVFLMATVSGQDKEVLRGKATDSSKTDGAHTHDTSDRSTVTFGTRMFHQQNPHIQARSVLNDTMIAKSLLDKIVGGTESRLGEIPWQARVTLFGYTRPSAYDCGAAIINEFWLVSAAHCFHGRARWRRHLIVGDHHVYRKDPGEQKFEVDRIYIHEEYNKIPRDYDVALIRIKPSSNGRGIQFNAFVQPICLPDSTTRLQEGSSLLVSGWGWIKPCKTCEPVIFAGSQNVPDVLMKANIPVISQDKCQRFYNETITDRMFCAGYADRLIDSCKGDSGGPVVYQLKGHYWLYGIVSWGGGCAQPNQPGVYARVPVLLPWIEGIVKSNSRYSLQYVITSKPE